MSSTPEGGDGDCFIAALHVAEAVADEYGYDVLVAHGLPLGQGRENLGRRFWHAWVETKPAGRGWMVADVSNGLRVLVPRTRYYRLGQLDPVAQVWRYTLDEAHRVSTEQGTYGPWVDGWEQMDETIRSADA